MKTSYKNQSHADYMKEWRAKQPPEWWERNRKYMKDKIANRAECEAQAIKEYKRKYFQDNWDHQTRRAKERLKRIKSDPESLKLLQEQRRAIKRSRVRGITQGEWNTLLEIFNYCCAYCCSPFMEHRPPEADHIIPIDQGGPRILANVVPSCRSCNAKKHNTHVMLFLQDLWHK